MHTHETCSCGSEITSNSPDQIRQWRAQHACTIVAPGPCWADSEVEVSALPRLGEMPATWRCELRAGHAGAHECDRGNLGKGVWPADGGDAGG